MSDSDSPLLDRVCEHLRVIYTPGQPDFDLQDWAQRLLAAMAVASDAPSPKPHQNHWDQSDLVLITYGDSLKRAEETPLHSLQDFLHRFLAESVSAVHILPFFPFSSDDGFAVIDYVRVNDSLGDWPDIEAIAGEFKLMSDLVINHCSSRSQWFENYKQGKDPGVDYFVEQEDCPELAEVVRPRTSPLLRPVETSRGLRHVWCTFSHDQVDLNFANPRVLEEFVGIMAYYLDRGVKWFRLDAVAFLWKELGGPCINLNQTHELIRLLRTLLEHRDPEAVIITETNIPNRENLAYFGNANEAHAIYNFSLPPLLVNSLVRGNCRHLTSWAMNMPPTQPGTFYLNFIASHDGIGLRPVEGLLDDTEVDELIAAVLQFGGRVSYRALNGKPDRPYEINIALYDALAGTLEGADDWQQQRFLCAHAIMLALEGVPAIYIHSFLATGNDQDKVAHTNNNRAINRHNWDYNALLARLREPHSHHAKVFTALQGLIAVRRRQPAFHPNAQQVVMHLGEAVFAFWRESADHGQRIVCLYNVTDQPQTVNLRDANLWENERWWDLLQDEALTDPEGELALSPYQAVWLSNRR